MYRTLITSTLVYACVCVCVYENETVFYNNMYIYIYVHTYKFYYRARPRWFFFSLSVFLSSRASGGRGGDGRREPNASRRPWVGKTVRAGSCRGCRRDVWPPLTAAAAVEKWNRASSSSSSSTDYYFVSVRAGIRRGDPVKPAARLSCRSPTRPSQVADPPGSPLLWLVCVRAVRAHAHVHTHTLALTHAHAHTTGARPADTGDPPPVAVRTRPIPPVAVQPAGRHRRPPHHQFAAASRTCRVTVAFAVVIVFFSVPRFVCKNGVFHGKTHSRNTHAVVYLGHGRRESSEQGSTD